MEIFSKIFTNKTMRYAYLGWFAIALFYFYQYILRVSPGVMIDEIRAAYSITAEQFATLGAFYLIAYSLLQIPLGIIVDRIGVKKMCMYSIVVCIIGTIMFAQSEQFYIAQISRFVIGLGSASAFMCALKFIADHIAPGKRGFLMGATLALGTVGALASGHSVEFLGEAMSWREALMVTALIGAVVLFACFVVLKDSTQDVYTVLNRKPIKQVMGDVKSAFKNSNIMIYAILAIGLYTPLSAIADLWGTAFIKEKYGLTKAHAAQIVMVLYVGLTIGSIVLPWLSEKYDILNQSIMFCIFALLGVFSLIVYLPAGDTTSLMVLLFLVGFFCGAEMMCFTGALVGSNRDNSGEIIGVVNTLNMLGGAFVQQAIGWSLDMQWSGFVDEAGLRQYSTMQFQNAVSILTGLIAICCMCSMILVRMRKKRSYEAI